MKIDYHNSIRQQFAPLRFKGGGGDMPAAPKPSPTKYTAEAEAAKRDILERNKGARGRAASMTSTPGLASILPDLGVPKLKGKLG